MSQDVKHRTALSPERRALLELRLKEKRGNSATRQRITRGEHTSVYPLSFEQERLWFLHLLEPTSLMHNLNRTSTLAGPLNVKALQDGFDEVVRRHEMLRTTLTLADGRPVQIVEPARAGMLPLIDLTEFPAEERQARADAIAAQQARQPFDMTKGPLMRAALIRLSEEKHALPLTLHHVITDWWSFGLLYRELLTLYQAFLRGESSPLPELEIQYGDYARWQREWLRGKELDTLVSYWKQQLSRSPQLLNLPTDRPRPKQQSSSGRRLRFEFPKELYQSLEELSRAESVTPFVAALAVYQVLLHRYTAQEEILVGTPSANRNKLETERLIGFLLNTLVLRGDLSGDPSFRELLARLRETVVGAYAHQDLPFQKLVEELNTERNLNVMPLVQADFVFLSTHSPNLDAAVPELGLPELPGLTAQLSNVEIIASEFDLTLGLENRATYLDGFFEYNTDLFDRATIQRMVGHLRTLMEAVVNDPDRRISQLPMLTAEESKRLLPHSEDVPNLDSTFRHVTELFEAQAANTPDAIAVTLDSESLSYRELNERANNLAHHLRQLGVGPEVGVGLLLERSSEMVVALLAILKAGGFYVPLDPTYPTDRLELMLKDTGAQFLLTQEALAERFPTNDIETIRVDTHREVIAQQSAENVVNNASPYNLAYVIFTSGSTGRPKGVQIPHGALSSFLNCMRQDPGLTSDDVFIALATISFDISTLEIFLPLTMGSRFVLADYAAARDGKRLLSLIEQHGVTVVQATPSTWHLLLEAGWERGRELKLLSGAEALPRQVAAALLERSGSVWNLYGPTETTVWSHLARLTAEHETHFIGYPLAHAQSCVLDRELQPVPIGVAGEIYIGGAGVARGYANSPALTAERFVPNPFSTRPGARWYRTGDLGRARVDGSIEFLGRRDHQVKVRGMRIELGEIETVLRAHPDVRECVVMVHGEQIDASLVAYVVAANDRGIDVEPLREFLYARLPRHMVPAAFLELKQLPRLPNGKIDRRSLPAPDKAQLAWSAVFIAPRNELERTIARIWCEVLDLEQVGIHDNFFEIGGHSLRLPQLQLKLEQTLERDFALVELFQYPTVSAFTAHLQTEAEEESLAGSEARGARRKTSSSQQRERRQNLRAASAS